MIKIITFTPPIKRTLPNLIDAAMINVIGVKTIQKIKEIKKYKRRVANRKKLHKRKKVRK